MAQVDTEADDAEVAQQIAEIENYIDGLTAGLKVLRENLQGLKHADQLEEIPHQLEVA